MQNKTKEERIQVRSSAKTKEAFISMTDYLKEYGGNKTQAEAFDNLLVQWVIDEKNKVGNEIDKINIHMQISSSDSVIKELTEKKEVLKIQYDEAERIWITLLHGKDIADDIIDNGATYDITYR